MPRLVSATLAGLVLAALLLGGSAYAEQQERQAIRAVAGMPYSQKLVGAALQAEAFRQDDLLPVYGSSELLEDSPYRAGRVFREAPSGFMVFEVATPGFPLLSFAQGFASLGPDLRGKRVVVAFVFQGVYPERADQYAGHFSRLHAGSLAFSPDLSFETKQLAARQLLKYPGTLRDEPLLRFALSRLDDGSPLGRAQYYAAWPLGTLANAVLRLQDHWEVLSYLAAHPVPPTPPAALATTPPNWSMLIERAEQEAAQAADNNPFGFGNDYWSDHWQWLVRPYDRPQESQDADFRAVWSAEKNWAAYQLLLRELTELGARPLMLSLPAQGRHWDYLGLSAGARREYYDRLHILAAQYRIPLCTFDDHDEDGPFLVDRWHPSAAGWAHIDRALDDFEHDRLRLDGTDGCRLG